MEQGKNQKSPGATSAPRAPGVRTFATCLTVLESYLKEVQELALQVVVPRTILDRLRFGAETRMRGIEWPWIFFLPKLIS